MLGDLATYTYVPGYTCVAHSVLCCQEKQKSTYCVHAMPLAVTVLID